MSSGGPPFGSTFSKKTVKLAAKLEKVHFLGEIPRDQVRRLLKKGDVFILPSRDEVFPTSLLEAMAEGKGVIVSEVGGLPK